MHRTGSGSRATFLLLVLLPALAVTGCRHPAGTGEAGETLRRGDDLLAGGGQIEIGEGVPGDVIAAGGSIAFAGTAGGDYLGAGGEQQVGGAVTGSVRAAGGNVELNSRVGRNVTMAGGMLDVGPDAFVAGNAYIAGGDVRLTGRVVGFLHVSAGDVLLNGRVGRDVRVNARRLRVGPDARIEGSLDHNVAPGNLTIDPSAQIAGGVVARPPAGRRFEWLVRIVWHLGFLLAGAVVVALLPRSLDAAGRALAQRPWAAAGFGLVWVLAVPIVVAIIAMTLVGIPLALVLLALYLVSIYLGRAIVALWLGRFMLGDRAGPRWTGAVLSFLSGGLILVILSLIPWVGGLVTLAATLVGLGALMLLRGRRAGGSLAGANA